MAKGEGYALLPGGGDDAIKELQLAGGVRPGAVIVLVGGRQVGKNPLQLQGGQAGAPTRPIPVSICR